MWKKDEVGTEFANKSDALRALRDRAVKVIAEAERQGRDTRSVRVRMVDDQGTICFDGTMSEASKMHIAGLGLSLFLAADALLFAVSDMAGLAEVLT